MSSSRFDEPNGWRGHPLLLAVLFTALIGVSVRFPWWSSWHHWWVAPAAYVHHLAHLVRTAWDHPPAK